MVEPVIARDPDLESDPEPLDSDKAGGKSAANDNEPVLGPVLDPVLDPDTDPDAARLLVGLLANDRRWDAEKYQDWDPRRTRVITYTIDSSIYPGIQQRTRAAARLHCEKHYGRILDEEFMMGRMFCRVAIPAHWPDRVLTSDELRRSLDVDGKHEATQDRFQQSA